ncbi:MAG: M23 family metallopeptidase, partial [Candidatus Altiarchaeota archaeon]|nr:M23 family metallopeptidase [Candidatus Altiarchaeota archaeon]
MCNHFEASSVQGQIGSDSCCNLCPEPYYFRWPAVGTEVVDNSITSTCEGNNPGLDIRAADGESVFAVGNGTVTSFINNDLNGYDCGCGMQLVTDDGKWRATYCHLVGDSRWMMSLSGRRVFRGNVLAYAGGGQSNATCRGASTSPRLHFRLEYNYNGQWRYVDSNTCFMDTCQYWYTQNADASNQCIPHEGDNTCSVTPNYDITNELKYRWPTYASDPSVGAGGIGIYWYAKVTVGSNGILYLNMSDVYDISTRDIQKATTSNKARINDFVKLVRVYSNGDVECGRIQAGGSVTWGSGASYCDDIIGIGLSDFKRGDSLGSNGIVFLEYRKNPDAYGKYLVVSEEYEVIGVNDKDIIDRYMDPSFNQELTVYYLEYILARKCDLYGPSIVTRQCKDGRIAYYDNTHDYEWNVEELNYTDCEWNIIDSGKYYDYPGVYLSTINFSRMSVYAGYRLTKVGEDLTSDGILHITTKNINIENWWDAKAGYRTVGCDGCEKMNDNLACTMGASLAQSNYFFGTGTPPYYHEIEQFGSKRGCGYWSPTAADYYGFDDRDDDIGLDADGYRDMSYDMESGKPDKDIIQKDSIETIKSNVSIYVIRDVTWRGPPHWVNIHDIPDPNSISSPSEDYTTFNDWLMPCANYAEYKCEETGETIYDTVQDQTPCIAMGYTQCDMKTYPGHPDCNHPENCKNPTTNSSCPTAVPKQCNPHKWRCATVNTQTGQTCSDWCCLGGVKIDDAQYKSQILNYSEFPHNRNGATGDDLNDNEPIAATPPVLSDPDDVRDRYWEVEPTEGAAWGSRMQGTRPGYNSGTSSRDMYDRPTSLQHNACDACRKDDTCPEICMTYDIRYYRQFGIDSVWAHVFKASPELNLYFNSGRKVIDMNPACQWQNEPPEEGKLDRGELGCTQNSNCSHGDVCTPGNRSIDRRCCPLGTTYDITYGCCMQCGVSNVTMYDLSYCEIKRSLGGNCKCQQGEGNCRSNEDCETGLNCTDNIYTPGQDSACCGPGFL